MSREKPYLTEAKLTSSKKSARFRRLSRFLPQLNTESKSQGLNLLSTSQHQPETMNMVRISKPPPSPPSPSSPQSPSSPPSPPSPPSPLSPLSPISSRSPRSPPQPSRPAPNSPPQPSRPAPNSPPPCRSPEISPCSIQEVGFRRHTSPPSSVSLPSPLEPAISRNNSHAPLSSGRIVCNEQRPMTSVLSIRKSQLLVPERESPPGRLRKSWLPGSRARSAKPNNSERVEEPLAWVNVGPAKIEYNLTPLVEGDRVSELWQDTGNVFIHLWPPQSGVPAQFHVPLYIIKSSAKLCKLIHGFQFPVRLTNDEGPSLTNLEATEYDSTCTHQSLSETPSQISCNDGSMSDFTIDTTEKNSDFSLFFPTRLPLFGPLTPADVQELIQVRNLFAFLTNQPLVATHSCPNYLKIFLSIAALLDELQFSNEDGTSYGIAVDLALNLCLKEIPHLVDCRESREATVQALILAEAMKSTQLYHEAFAHAAGKYVCLAALKQGSIIDLISPTTRNRLEKSSRELKQRIRSMNDRLYDFEFPSLFAGIAASTSSEESKIVRFKKWRLSFMAFRKQIIAYYKDLYGQWPPRTTKKKMNYVEGGLNRLVLIDLYRDLCELYNLLADRESLTTRVYDGDGGEEPPNVTPAAQTLRRLLDEYDRSRPPVQPPIPFDIPLVPSLRSINPQYQDYGPKEKYKKIHRKLSHNEVSMILIKSHNPEANSNSRFIKMFKAFEVKEGKGKSSFELSEQRHGHWIFLYACLQALPLLVTDVPNLQYIEGVEYFLCQVPLGNLPWVEDQTQVKMSWFGVQGGQQIVSLPSDVVNHGVEATYTRSHCWVMAQKWLENEHQSITSSSTETRNYSPLSPPPGFGVFGSHHGRSRSERDKNSEISSQCSSRNSTSSLGNSRTRNLQYQRSTNALGLERVRIDSSDFMGSYHGPRGVYSPNLNNNTPSRPGSRGQSYSKDMNRDWGDCTFDDILGSMKSDQNTSNKKGKKKKTGEHV